MSEQDRSLRDLQWNRIVDAVAARCRGPLAHRMQLPIASTRAGMERALQETSEATSLLEQDERLPMDGVCEIGEALQRVDRRGVLDAPSLRDVMKTLAAARALRLYLSKRRETLPTLWHSCTLDPTLDRLHEELAACIDADGTLADHASPELRRLRTEVANLRARIVRRLDQMLVEHDAVLQDRFHTIREGRYVLPVRRDAHEKISGIVHGTSASGATVFVEPRALVGQGNRLKMAHAEMEREELRILGELSELVRERIAELRAAVDAIDHADLRQASAVLGQELGARVLEVSHDGRASLVDARHPILMLDGIEVVPGSIHVANGRALVISGPNAGGKTVSLKTLGLAALMSRAGLPFPAGEDSSCGFFDVVLTDVGDEQSLQKNLSTFSAHITNISRILAATRRASAPLVLLDELATGTDPMEGAALACSLVDALLRMNAGVVVTTHYEAVKAMASRDERMDNAAVGFDVEAMAPTFELVHGLPGASSAFAVAFRFGVPESVIATAREILPEQSKTFDELVRGLEAQRRELVMDKAALDDTKREMAEERQALLRTRQKLEKRREKVLDEESSKLRDELRRARQALRDARRAMKKKADGQSLEETRKKIDAAAKAVALRPEQEPDSGDPLDPSTLKVGMRVHIPRLRSDGDIVEGPTKGRVRVSAGALRLWVDVGDLRAPGSAKASTATHKQRAKPEDSTAEPKPAGKPSPQTTDNTLDVRGLRVDEAMGLAESFLDRMYGDSQRTAYILHGLGSGALRDAIREQLQRDATYVQSFRPGTRDEGGDRFTVVTLK